MATNVIPALLFANGEPNFCQHLCPQLAETFPPAVLQPEAAWAFALPYRFTAVGIRLRMFAARASLGCADLRPAQAQESASATDKHRVLDAPMHQCGIACATLLATIPCPATGKPVSPRGFMLKLNAVSWNRPSTFPQRPHGKLGAKLNCYYGLRRVVRFVSTIMSEAGYAKDDVNHVCSACEEALQQALQGRHDCNAAREVEFSCHVDDCGVRVEIQNLGPNGAATNFNSRNSLGSVDWMAVDTNANRIAFGKRPSSPLNPAVTLISA